MTALAPMPRRRLLAHVFVSRTEPRLRAGWRVLLQIVLLAVLTVVAALGETAAAAALRPWLDRGIGPSPRSVRVGLELGLVLPITASVWLARRLLDRRGFRSLGLTWRRRTDLDLAFGVAVAGLVLGLVYLAELALGWSAFVGFAWQERSPGDALSSAGWSLLLWVGVGWQEELVSRGYWLRNLTDGLGLRWGLLFSSVLFAISHLANPAVSWTAVVGLVAAGYFLAYGCIRTGDLWIPIGLHVGWNFFEGTVFGFQVSGVAASGLIRQVTTGLELWTGGGFGPEAGLIILPAMALGTLLIWLYTRPFSGRRASNERTSACLSF